MSPTSRGRRPKRKPSAPRGQHPGRDAALAQVLHEVGRELAATRDALDAELVVSSVAGAWWDVDLLDADPEVEFGERLVAYATAHGRDLGALALLRVLAELGTPAQREAAATGAAALGASGVPEPSWADELREVRHTGSWAYGDVFGDQTSVLLAFARPHRRHGIAVLVDHTVGGIAKDAFVTDDPAGTLDEMRSTADETVWIRELSAAEAASLLVPAFAATDAGHDLPLGSDFRDTRALAVARLRLLPAPPAVLGARTEDPGPLVEAFLTSDARPTDLDEDVVAACARLIAQVMADIDGQPGRVSPAKLELLWFEHVPDALEDDDPRWDGLPAVLRSWVGGAGRRTGLSLPAQRALGEIAEEILDAAGGVPDDLIDALLDGVPDDAVPEQVSEILARRAFAVGEPRAILDGQELAIDPSDPDERGLAIRAEHPEYADALADPFGDALVDGVNPRLHIAMHEVVANQLWDGEPAETWATAQRLLAAGIDRHDVLHALADVAARHVHAALVEHRPYDAEAYAADLAALGTVRPARRR